MEWFASIILAGLLCWVVVKKLLIPMINSRKLRKKIPKNFRNTKHKATTQKLIAYLHKNSLKICLDEDGKFYGSTYKNGDPPELPHAKENCKCKYKTTPPSHHHLFDKKSTIETFKTDLGDLDFYQYKYYKYSLLLKIEKNDKSINQIKEFRTNLNINEEFKNKVEKHLS